MGVVPKLFPNASAAGTEARVTDVDPVASVIVPDAGKYVLMVCATFTGPSIPGVPQTATWPMQVVSTRTPQRADNTRRIMGVAFTVTPRPSGTTSTRLGKGTLPQEPKLTRPSPEVRSGLSAYVHILVHDHA